jgi:transcription-repair coupling factor (superfamily II helicase)
MNILEFFLKNKKVKDITESSYIRVSDSCDGFNMMLIASDFMSGNSTLFVVLPTLYLAQRYYDDMCRIINYDDVLFFPADELISAEMISASGDFLYERIETLYTLIEGKKKLVIMNMHAAIKYEMKKEIWINSCFYINNNETILIN